MFLNVYIFNSILPCDQADSKTIKTNFWLKQNHNVKCLKCQNMCATLSLEYHWSGHFSKVFFLQRHSHSVYCASLAGSNKSNHLPKELKTKGGNENK